MKFRFRRPLLTAGLTLFITILLCEALSALNIVSPPLLFLLTGLAAAGSVCLFILYRINKHSDIILMCAVVCFSAACGILRWTLPSFEYEAVRNEYCDKSVRMTVTVITEPESAKNGCLCTVIPDADSPIKQKLLFYTSERIDIYDRVTATFLLTRLKDEYRLRAEGTVLFSVADRNSASETVQPEKYPPAYLITMIRRYIRTISQKAFGEYSALTESLLLGGTDTLTEGQFTALKEAGLLHITCVSGLHIGIFTGAVVFLLSFLKKKRLTFTVTALSVLGLLIICGFSPSSVRAAMFSLTVLLYRGSGIKPDGLNLLGLPLTLLLTVNPFYAVDVSFLLSFSSVFGILLFYERVNRNILTRYTAETASLPDTFIRWLSGVFSLSLVCTVSTIPVSLIFFGTACAGSVFSGVVCLWTVTPVYIGALLCVLLYPLPFLKFITYPLIFTVRKGVSFIMSVSEILSGSGLSSFDLSQFSPESISENFAFWVAIFIVAVFILLVFRPYKKEKNNNGKTGRPGLLFFLLPAVFILVGIYFVRYLKSPVSDGEKLTVGYTDVGQGSCSVLIQGDNTAVIDCGGTDLPTEQALEFISKYGADDIDYLIITHLHADHVNGVEKLLKRIDVDVIYIPYTTGDESYYEEVLEAAEFNGVEVKSLSADAELTFGEGTIDILTAHLSPDAEENDNSMIIKAQFGDTSFLFTGDITKKGEASFIKAYPFVHATVLAVPHHGSAYSSSEDFLASVQPELSVISVSATNSYGHPAQATVERLQLYGKVLTTSEYGCIRLESDGKGYTVYTEKKANETAAVKATVPLCSVQIISSPSLSGNDFMLVRGLSR